MIAKPQIQQSTKEAMSSQIGQEVKYINNCRDNNSIRDATLEIDGA
jgi:hypothetical protein